MGQKDFPLCFSQTSDTNLKTDKDTNQKLPSEHKSLSKMLKKFVQPTTEDTIDTSGAATKSD